MRFQIAQALAHFLWEGAAIAALLWLLLQILRDAKARYNACAGALALMCVAPVATFFWLTPHAMTAQGARGIILDTALPAARAATLNWLEANAAWLFCLWASGVLVLVARAVVAWWKARDMVTRDFGAVPGSVESAARRLAVQFGAKQVRFRASARVASALVFGWLKPVIVLPAAALGRLTEAEIEAPLAHELAHVIRGDFLANLLQTVAECVLFYHPLVWWVSARMRDERELCCDDIAVAVCRDEVLYSRALLRLEELRMEPALAATGGRLAQRIRRLLAGTESGRITAAPGLALMLLLGVSVALLAQVALPQPQAPPASPTGSVAAYPVGGDVTSPRVVYKIEPEYTEEAHAARIEGTVTLSIVVSAEGNATEFKVVKSLDKGLDNKAIEAIRKWRFEPGRKSGQPVPVIATVEITFLLDPPAPPVAPLPPAPATPKPAVAPQPPEPPSKDSIPPVPPAPPAPPSRGVVGGVAGGVQGGIVGGVPVAPTSSDLAELERRKRYAADHFGGANTDRGKVYVRYGPPDEIDSHPSPGKSLETWSYKDASRTKVILEVEFRDGRLVKRTGALAADR